MLGGLPLGALLFGHRLRGTDLGLQPSQQRIKLGDLHFFGLDVVAGGLDIPPGRVVDRKGGLCGLAENGDGYDYRERHDDRGYASRAGADS